MASFRICTANTAEQLDDPNKCRRIAANASSPNAETPHPHHACGDTVVDTTNRGRRGCDVTAEAQD